MQESGNDGYGDGDCYFALCRNSSSPEEGPTKALGFTVHHLHLTPNIAPTFATQKFLVYRLTKD